MRWISILCGVKNRSPLVEREAMQCVACASTWRVRATALGVLLGTASPVKPFSDVPRNYFWRGLGISDHMTLAGGLASRFDYTNSYYHRFPRLDLLDPGRELESFFGFITCSDVLEHVPPNADRALSGMCNILDTHGFAVISVPSGGSSTPTREFYPDLVEWTEVDGLVIWKDSEGVEHVDSSPEFHGGGGQTLAFRLWGEDDLRERLIRVGFRAVRDIPFCEELGVPPLENHGVFIAHR